MQVMLQMPLAIAQKYLGGPFSSEFNEFLEKKSIKVMENATTPQKRTASGPTDSPQESPKKRCSPVDPKMIVDGATITATLLFSCKLTGQSKNILELQIRDGNIVTLANLGASEVTLQKGTVLGAFGKGSFKLVKPDEGAPLATLAPPTGVPYKLSTESDLVMVGGAVRSLGTVIQEQRAKQPAATACYHRLDINEADPSKFTLELTHHVFFVPTSIGDSDTVKDSNIGVKLPAGPDAWNSHCTAIIWAVRWVTKGLQAQSPKIVLNKDVALPPNSALIILGAGPGA